LGGGRNFLGGGGLNFSRKGRHLRTPPRAELLIGTPLSE